MAAVSGARLTLVADVKRVPHIRTLRETIGFFGTEAYCRSKWQYKLRYAYDLINAAKVHTFLCANCAKVKPDHESQVRPLVGLPPELAKQAWETAVDRAQGQRITARLVKSVVKALKPPKPDPDPQSFCSIGERELGTSVFEFYARFVAGIDQRPAFCHKDRKEHKKAAAGKCCMLCSKFHSVRAAKES